MSIKITTEAYDVNKALNTEEGNRQSLIDVTSGVEQRPVKPGLLTALLGVNRVYGKTTTIEFDVRATTVQLPSGKAYHEKGKDLNKDQNDSRLYKIPSFGLRMNVAPEDVSGQRKQDGSMELMQPEDILAELLLKAPVAWDLQDELAIAQLITADTNYVGGGPFQVYNFYTDIVGSPRPAAFSMDFGTSTADHVGLARAQGESMQEELQRAGLTSSSNIVICSRTFFDAKYAVESMSGLPRPITWGLDLAVTPRPEMRVSGHDFNVPWFDSRDGNRYVLYSASINGTPLIPADDAFMIPVGADIVTIAHAPAQRLSTVNETALRLYTWQHVSEERGYSQWMESNALYANKLPRVIRHLTI